jgi:LuxR family maltose regulon positive regulatory protein
MTMSFLLQDSPGDTDTSEIRDPVKSRIRNASRGPGQRLTIFGEKLRVPKTGQTVPRARLTHLLTRSASNFGATLLSGRAGTGKTTIAAEFALGQPNAIWYSIDPTDSSWSTFSVYFRTALLGTRPPAASRKTVPNIPEQAEIAEFLTSSFGSTRRGRKPRSNLIVLDDIHHLFDAVWFDNFFQQLIATLPPSTHLLMTCRSKPPAPLWRLRSKQVLNVIDEGLMEFTLEEGEQLCRLLGLPESLAADAQRRSFGRISKLIESLEECGRSAC